jgi:hypothetical protein
MEKNTEFKHVDFGGVVSPDDYRDIPLSAVFGAGVLPDTHILNIEALPRDYQAKIGSCVGHASAKIKQRADYDETGSVFKLSPRFIYGMAKKVDGLPVGQEGTYYRLGVKILQQYGCITEEFVPNDYNMTHAQYIDLDALNIPREAWDMAKKFKIGGYARIGSWHNVTLDAIKRAVVEGDGVLLGLELGEEWWHNARGVASWGEDIMPIRPPQKLVSGHAIYVYGYEKVGERTKVWFRNSWSKNWGINGNGWFWYDEYAPFMTEAWGITDIPNHIVEQVKELPAKEKFSHCFKRASLRYGYKNKEIVKLQTALMIHGVFDKDLYSRLLKKNQLGYYGSITRKALNKYMRQERVAPLWSIAWNGGWNVGPATERALNKQFCKR